MFDRIFGTMVADPELRNRVYRRRTAVLDAVYANVKVLKPQLSRADNLHLDAHMAALETLEGNLAALQNVECSVTEDNTPNLGSKQAYDYKPRQIQAQMDMLVNALACDMTRVATFAYRDDDWSSFPTSTASPCRATPFMSSCTTGRAPRKPRPTPPHIPLADRAVQLPTHRSRQRTRGGKTVRPYSTIPWWFTPTASGRVLPIRTTRNATSSQVGPMACSPPEDTRTAPVGPTRTCLRP